MQLTVLAYGVPEVYDHCWQRVLPWVAWNPDFRESKNLNAIRGRLLDELYGLVHTSVKVMPDRLGLNGSDSDGFLNIGGCVHVHGQCQI